ncbi:hypothetical protein ACHAXT_010441 [Thalassiosira profunda]
MNPSVCENTDAADVHRHHDVEIATLSLPAAASDGGVVLGDGTQFVLEASPGVIEQLAEGDIQQQTEVPCIEGVVDLTIASHLVAGITEDEFVGLLHDDAPHHVHQTPTRDEEKAVELRQSGEDQPLLHGATTAGADDDTAKCTLSADPFVQTLSEVHHAREDKEAIVIGATDALSSSHDRSFLHPNKEQPGDTGETTISREAFLLSVPNNAKQPDSLGEGPSNGVSAETGGKFVLALPEMHQEQPAQSAEMAKKEGAVDYFIRDSIPTAAETVVDLVDHAFDPLPTDVQHVDLRVSITEVPVPNKDGGGFHNEEAVHLDVVVDRKVPILGYVILVAGLLALSSIGAALDLQQGGVTPEMKIFWRLNCTSILFLCLAAKKLNRKELARFTWKQLWVEMSFAAMAYGTMNATFAVSLEMTSLVNAFILSNMASLIMIATKLCIGQPVLFYEGLGALIDIGRASQNNARITGFVGALICAAAGGATGDANGSERALQRELVNEPGTGEREMTGNMLAFAASVTTAIYLTVAKRLRPQVDLVLFMFMIFTLSSAFLLVYIVAFSGQEWEVSFDPVVGIFAWVKSTSRPALIGAIRGNWTMGYIAILKYFDAVVVIGVDTLPGWATWAGDAVVMVGSFLVIWSGAKKTETIDATDALQQLDEDATEKSGVAKSPYLRRSVNTPRLMKSPLLRSPKPRKRLETDDEMEFVSVRSIYSRSPQRVVWSSMKT